MLRRKRYSEEFKREAVDPDQSASRAFGKLVRAYLPMLRRPSRPRQVPLNLALQGGGAHGAFTWGVLDALLDDPRLVFEGISGSSAGAINAVVLANGWLRGGRDGARQALADFWGAIGAGVPWPLLTMETCGACGFSPAARLLMGWASYFSPVELNPMDLDPLRDTLSRQLDFERLRQASPFKLFIAATHANSGRLRIFREHELRVETLLASACLPRIHRAVEIDGEPYWDGGYSANPAVFPLVCSCVARDILLVLLSPLEWTRTPRGAHEIAERTAEFAFSAHFMREMRTLSEAIDLAHTPYAGFGSLARRLRGLRFHMIDAARIVELERTETKLLAYRPFLESLRDLGRARGHGLLTRHGDALGRHATLDLHRWFG